MSPELVTFLWMALVAIAMDGLYSWRGGPFNRPILLGRLGLFGHLLEVLMMLVVMVSVISGLVWSYSNSMWYVIVIAWVVSIFGAKFLLANHHASRMFFLSLLGPSICSVLLIALNLWMWFGRA